MTFSITARCERTGRLGVGVATHSLATGSRVPHVKALTGAVATQSNTNPRLGLLALQLMTMGYAAPKVLEEMKAADPYWEHRLFAVVDKDGHSAVSVGPSAREWKGSHVGDGYVTAGSGLSGPRVVADMAQAFEASRGEELEERLLRGIEAGRDAGGQDEGQRSACLLTYDWDVFPYVSLRVDIHDGPETELRRIYELFKPYIRYYNIRAADPRLPRGDDWVDQQVASRP
jgi:uncharacterized Ntn-hydrolase superfamily protein